MIERGRQTLSFKEAMLWTGLSTLDLPGFLRAHHLPIRRGIPVRRLENLESALRQAKLNLRAGRSWYRYEGK